MHRFRASGFVGTDTLEFLQGTGDVLYLAGQIGCIGEIVIEVEKKLEIVGEADDPEVQTAVYSYHVTVQKFASLFRYDNQHPDVLHYGHSDEHHVHRFKWASHDELPESPVWIGSHRWPTLGQVIEEARDWYWDNFLRLPHPHEFATNLRRGWGS